MGKSNTAYLAFNGGEGDAETMARADLDLYSRTASQMENIFPYVQGKMSKAPGSQFLDEITALAELLDESGETLLDEAGGVLLSEGESLGIVRSFVRSGESAFVLELSAGQIRFIDNTTSEYVMLDGADATIGVFSDQSAAPSTGGDPPIEPGYTDVTDPFYPDITYDSYVFDNIGPT
jgi:hypothetical protein